MIAPAQVVAGQPATFTATVSSSDGSTPTGAVNFSDGPTFLGQALLEHGIDHLAVVLAGLSHWMEERDYASVEQLKGSMSQRSCHDPTAFERAGYMKAITGYHLPAGT